MLTNIKSGRCLLNAGFAFYSVERGCELEDIKWQMLTFNPELIQHCINKEATNVAFKCKRQNILRNNVFATKDYLQPCFLSSWRLSMRKISKYRSSLLSDLVFEWQRGWFDRDFEVLVV